MLRLQREEEAGGEVVDAGHAGHVGVVGAVDGIEVPVLQHRQVPHAGEEEPRGVEGCREEDEDPLPAQVQEGDEEVLEELVGLAVHRALGVDL